MMRPHHAQNAPIGCGDPEGAARRWLVWRGGGLGDSLLIWPTLAALREGLGAEITLVGHPAYGELARAAGLVESILDLAEARWAPLFERTAPLPPALAAWLGGFAGVLYYLGGPEDDACDHFRRLGFGRPPIADGGHGGAPAAPSDGRSRRWLAAVPPLRAGRPGVPVELAEGPTEPAWRYHGRPLEALGLGSPLRPFHWEISAEQRASWLGEHAPPAPWMVFHPGSGSPVKNRPLAEWRTLADRRRRRFPGTIVWLLGPADGEAKSAFRRNPPPPTDRIAEDWPLPRLAALLAGARGFLGHDSGPAHLAALVGCPTRVWFGPSDPAIWAPPGATPVRCAPRLKSVGKAP